MKSYVDFILSGLPRPFYFPRCQFNLFSYNRATKTAKSLLFLVLGPILVLLL